MKKLLAALISVILAISLSACCCVSLLELKDKGSNYSFLSVNSNYDFDEKFNEIQSNISSTAEAIESQVQSTYESEETVQSSQPNVQSGNNCLELKKQELIDSYGFASQEPFVSCLGPDIQDYPSTIMGIIATYFVDIDGDNIDELIVIKTDAVQMAMHPVIVMQIYKNQNGTATHWATNTLYELSFCTAANIYMFYSKQLGKYCVMVDTASGGSYTGVDYWDAFVFTISDGKINEYATWSNIKGFDMSTDFDSEFKKIGAPYARYCTQYDNRSTDSTYLSLCWVEHDVYGDMSTYLTRNHKLAIKP